MYSNGIGRTNTVFVCFTITKRYLMKATILTIGDEILIGQIIDTNAAWMSQKLTALGISVVERVTVSDEHKPIVDAIRYCLGQSDIVLMTGGLGPTKDDITKVAIADYLGVGMEFHEEVFENIKKIFIPRNIPLSDAHKDQCYLPEKVEVLKNSMGTAPGMLWQHEGKQIVSMPGVPYEMKAIMSEQLLPRLAQRPDRKVILHKTIMTAGMGESSIADEIEDIVDGFDKELSIAYLPGLAQVRLRITAKGDDESLLQSKLDQAITRVSERIIDLVYGYDEISLQEALQQICIDRGLTVGTAESCTGGYLSHLMTSISGSSAYYQGSAITYSNALKQKMLGVKEDTLKAYGAVSEQVVKEMVEGAIQLLGVDFAVATSGVAGPTGGTEAKPVGTVCIAVGSHGVIETRTILASKDRSKNIAYASNQALNMLRKCVLQAKIS